MYMTKIMPIICFTGHCTKHYEVHFEKKALWMKPATANFGFRLMPDSLQGGRGYEQILASGFISMYKQGTRRIAVILLSSYNI